MRLDAFHIPTAPHLHIAHYVGLLGCRAVDRTVKHPRTLSRKLSEKVTYPAILPLPPSPDGGGRERVAVTFQTASEDFAHALCRQRDEVADGSSFMVKCAEDYQRRCPYAGRTTPDENGRWCSDIGYRVLAIGYFHRSSLRKPARLRVGGMRLVRPLSLVGVRLRAACSGVGHHVRVLYCSCAKAQFGAMHPWTRFAARFQLSLAGSAEESFGR